MAIIMDGSGRWARRRRLPRFAGHRAGVDAVRDVVGACGERGIEVLTVFAFSSENWRRPRDEVEGLMGLFRNALEQEARRLHENNVRLEVVGERGALNDMLRKRIGQAEELTRKNTGLRLIVAMNYGGRWDVTQACRSIAREVRDESLDPDTITPELLGERLSLSELPPPDLFIRTGGEMRVSNFLIWHLAYAELYFTETLWPDFDVRALDAALDAYAGRQRRFGRTSEQVVETRMNGHLGPR
ncbi:MAG: polyprenyl diphosphate synthase [Thiotrichales bacterium]|nr:polyprenyl diphosphate synthase [Thiotrichales bacterium]